MGQHLQGIEGRINYDFYFRHLSFARIQSRLGRAGTSSALLSLLLHFTLDGIGKTKEKRVARSENDKKPPPIPLRREGVLSILFEDSIEWNCDVNPLRTFGQQWGDNLMVTFAARKNLAVFDDFQYFWWKPRLGIIGYSYDNKLHSGSKFFTLHSSLFILHSSLYRSRPGLSCSASSKVRMALQSVAARFEPPFLPSTMILGMLRKGFTMCFDSRT